jgi:RNA polymerase sigma-70 factor (ECF subfamily)
MEPDPTGRQDLRLVFEQHRRRLWGIAYRMLGSRAEADDLVQEAYLRWHGSATAEIRAPEAWLVTAITRLAIDRLRQLRTERETYVGPWLPEPLVADPAPSPDQASELASDLSVAFLALLERLAPEERAAFLLHEVFDSDYGDIAGILGKSEAACRQIVSRARSRVRAARPRVQVSPAARTRLLHGLMQAIQARDKDALLKLFAEESTWTSDGGGNAKAALKSIHGADPIARFLVGVFRNIVDDLSYRTVTVNDEPGTALLVRGELFSILSIRTDGAHILDAYNIMNPVKLRSVQLGGRFELH